MAWDDLPAPHPDDIDARALVFMEQVEAWQAAGRPGIPYLTLPGVNPPLDRCFSCGGQVADGFSRCRLCVAAAWKVVGMLEGMKFPAPMRSTEPAP